MFYYGNGKGRRIFNNLQSWRVVTSYRVSHNLPFFNRFKNTRTTNKPLPFNNEAPYALSLPITGMGLSSSIGSETISGADNVVLSGIGLANAIGVESVSGAAGISQAGVDLTGAIGTVTVSAEIGTQDAEVIAVGIDLTSAVGNEAVSGAAVIPLSGIELTEALGSEQISGASNYVPAGIGLTSSIGTVGTSGGVEIVLIGIDLTESLGIEDVSGAANRVATGVTMTSNIGTVVVTAIDANSALIFASGIEAVSSIGSVIVTAVGGISKRPKVISFKQWLGNLPLADSYLEMPKKRKKVNAIVFVEPELILKSEMGTVIVNSQARCKIIPFKRINLEIGTAEIKIDYRNKMRKQEEEFVRFLMVA
jgi:hypothetical protein